MHMPPSIARIVAIGLYKFSLRWAGSRMSCSAFATSRWVKQSGEAFEQCTIEDKTHTADSRLEACIFENECRFLPTRRCIRSKTRKLDIAFSPEDPLLVAVSRNI